VKVVVSTLIVAAALTAAACRSDANAPVTGNASPATPSSASGARTVALAQVTSKSFERPLALPGDLIAFQDVAVHARVQGFIQSIPVDRGSVVRQGALLARIDAPELKAQLGEAQAKVQSAQAQLAESNASLTAERSTYDRLKQASATPGVVSEQDVEIAQQRAEAARARVEASSRNVEAATQAARSVQDIESYLAVTAPFDGVVTERNAHVGSLVGLNTAPIVRIQQVSRLRLTAAIPEAYAAGIRDGQPIDFSVATFPGETFNASVARISHALDPKTRSMTVELDVPNANGRLAPGMFASVRWPARRAVASLFVPRTAVVTTTERTFVIRVNGDTAEWVDVKRGAAMDDQVEVFGALDAGDRVIARGTDEIRPGGKIAAAPPASKS
jgi:membrane fusion protein, multidrug efflux system